MLARNAESARNSSAGAQVGRTLISQFWRFDQSA
jgi:hypothetical protein